MLAEQDRRMGGWMDSQGPTKTEKQRALGGWTIAVVEGLIQYVQDPGFNLPSQKQRKGVWRELVSTEQNLMQEGNATRLQY